MKRLVALVAVLAATGIALADGGIAGQVVDATNGQPIEGAMVLARGSNDVGRARTNARGVYLIENLEEGRYHVSAAARGYEPAEQGPVGVRDGEITRNVGFRLQPKQQPDPGVITGRVVDRKTGEPLSHARVVAVTRGCRRAGRTDEEGRYVLRGLKPGVYRVTANARHYVKHTLPGGVAVRAGQTVTGVNFALVAKPRHGAIAGRVVNARTHRPVAGALVVARGEHGMFRARTDRHGCYRIAHVHPGAYRVTAAARGYRTESFPRRVPVHPGRATRGINFHLHKVRADAD